MKQVILSAIIVLFAAATMAAESKNNVVILFDTSGSMQESMHSTQQAKIDVAKKVLCEVAGKLPADTNIGLITFGGWVYNLGPVDQGKLINSIRNLQISEWSGTPLGTYMKTAADALLQQREKAAGYGTYKLFIITDGEANNEPSNLVGDYLADILSRGLRVECVGVDMTDNHMLSKKVHRYMRADDPESFKTSVQKIIPEVQASKDDVSSFDEIKPLPPQMCKAIITALCTSGNHPIGTTPPSQPQADNVPTTTPMATTNTSVETYVGIGVGVVIGVVLVLGLIAKMVCGDY